MNAWSSLAFVIAGNFFISKAFGEGGEDALDADHSNMFERHPILPLLLGVSFVNCGVGSWVYHASMTRAGLFLDYATIMVAGPYVSLYAYLDLREGEYDEEIIDKYILPAYALLVITSYILTYTAGSYYTATAGPLFTALTLYGTQAKYSENTDYFYSRAATALFFLALGVFSEDPDGPCDPDSILQMHALWHVMVASSMLLGGLFFYSENGVQLAYF